MNKELMDVQEAIKAFRSIANHLQAGQDYALVIKKLDGLGNSLSSITQMLNMQVEAITAFRAEVNERFSSLEARLNPEPVDDITMTYTPNPGATIAPLTPEEIPSYSSEFYQSVYDFIAPGPKSGRIRGFKKGLSEGEVVEFDRVCAELKKTKVVVVQDRAMTIPDVKKLQSYFAELGLEFDASLESVLKAYLEVNGPKITLSQIYQDHPDIDRKEILPILRELGEVRGNGFTYNL